MSYECHSNTLQEQPANSINGNKVTRKIILPADKTRNSFKAEKRITRNN